MKNNNKNADGGSRQVEQIVMCKKYWDGQSPYGCKYAVKFNPKYTKGVELSFKQRVKLLFGADLLIAHHT